MCCSGVVETRGLIGVKLERKEELERWGAASCFKEWRRLIGVKLERKEELRPGRWGAVKLCADRCGQTLDKAHSSLS